MEFTDQITNARLQVVNKPREFVKWDNTEPGRDKDDCYERLDIGGSIIYINNNNRSVAIVKGQPFWNTLEDMYQKLKAESLQE